MKRKYYKDQEDRLYYDDEESIEDFKKKNPEYRLIEITKKAASKHLNIEERERWIKKAKLRLKELSGDK